jgi:hypothetical protein
MIEPTETPAGTRYEQCGHLVWRVSAGLDTPSPGPYCDSPIGVFPVLDCPVFQGRSCGYFEVRPEETSPEIASEERLEALSATLAEDYLGWRYWRRIERLSAGPEPRVRE